MGVSMSKRSKEIDDKQLTIFDALNRIKASPIDSRAGALQCADRLREALRAAIKGSPLSVHQIAGEMSHLVGETITAEVIYSWTRQSDDAGGRNGRHIPAQYLPAFCVATKNNGILEIMGELAGAFVLPGPDALRSEIQKEDEVIRAAKERKRERQNLLKQLEGRNG